LNGAEVTAAALQQADTEIDRLTYAVSHDLRAPVRAVLGYAAALDEDYGTQLDDEGRRLLAIISREAQRTMSMIDALLELSRIGRQVAVVEPLDMMAIVQEVATELSIVAILDMKVLPESRGDRSLIRRVWSKVLANARIATKSRSTPHISVWATEETDRVIYHVQDNGIGFDMSYPDEPFAIFRKLHHDREFPGLGNGLAAVKQIVCRHGGEVWAEGRVGEGATFSFALPIGCAM
jgi:light-regulated signal transduction histidine kinase (bacteriophytochrome)